MDLDFIKVLSSSKSLLGSPKLEIVSLSSLKHWFYLIYLTNVSSFSNDLLPGQNHIRLFYVQVDMLDSPNELSTPPRQKYTLSVCHGILVLYFSVLQNLEVHSWWGWRSLNCRVLFTNKGAFLKLWVFPHLGQKGKTGGWHGRLRELLHSGITLCFVVTLGLWMIARLGRANFPYSNLPWWSLCASGSRFV